MTTPLVSVVITTYNRAHLISVSLDSILKQTFTDYEIIVVDDASPDQTMAVLKSYQHKFPCIRAFRNPVNAGVSASRNFGVQQAQGKYVAILDDDDMSVNTRLEKQVNILEQNPDAGLCFGQVEHIDDTGKTLLVFPAYHGDQPFPAAPPKIFKQLLCDGNRVTGTTMMGRREILLQHPFPEQILAAEDWDVALEIAGDGIRLIFIPEVLVYADRSRVREGLTENKLKLFSWQRKVIQKISREYNVSKKTRNHALANQYCREAHYLGGPPGIKRLFAATRLEPFNPLIIHTLRRIITGHFRRRLHIPLKREPAHART